jgi:hypothetical protein
LKPSCAQAYSPSADIPPEQPTIFMSYQQGSGTPRDFDRPKKTRVKQKSKTRNITASRRGERDAESRNEVVALTLAGFEILGAQTFAMAPFRQHFDRWLKSLQTVLDDFETSSAIEVDDTFRGKCTGLFSAVEAALKAEQTKEVSREATILGLHGSKDLLFHMDQRHAEKLREQAARRDAKLKILTGSVEILRAELDEVFESKAGFFEGITKSKAKREREARTKLTVAEKELENAKASFAVELTGLQEEHERKRQAILEKVASERREIDILETEAEMDGSVDVRHAACEELSEAVNALIKRLEATTP